MMASSHSPIFLPNRKNTADRRIWHGMAFILEALVLLLFLVISMAVLIQLFGSSRTLDSEATSLNRAVTLASNEAERFSAEPGSDVTKYYLVEDGALSLSDEETEGSYIVSRIVETENQNEGTLYRATITVEHYDEIVYEIESASYKQNTGGS